MRRLFEEGFYPPDLLLLEETSITLTELDSMDPNRKGEYYLFIKERKRKQQEEIDKRKNNDDGIPKNTYYREEDL